MKRNKYSLCAVALGMSLLGLSSTAMAEDVNPLTGKPSDPTLDNGVLAVPAPAPVATPNVLSPAPVSDIKVKSDVKVENKNDISSEATADTLKEAASLQAKIKVKTMQLELKKIDDELSGKTANNGNNLNAMNNGQPLPPGQQFPLQQVDQFNQAQAAQPQFLTKPAKKGPEVNATAVYGLGKDAYAEIYFGQNKYVAKVGTELPYNYRLVGMNANGITMKKGNTTIKLPIVDKANFIGKDGSKVEAAE